LDNTSPKDQNMLVQLWKDMVVQRGLPVKAMLHLKPEVVLGFGLLQLLEHEVLTFGLIPLSNGASRNHMALDATVCILQPCVI
jgi:hypothetical protein